MYSFVGDVLLSTILNHHETSRMECHKVVILSWLKCLCPGNQGNHFENGASNLEDDKPLKKRTVVGKPTYTPLKTNIAMENGPGLKMYFLLKMVMFQPAMLIYQRANKKTYIAPKNGGFE